MADRESQRRREFRNQLNLLWSAINILLTHTHACVNLGQTQLSTVHPSEKLQGSPEVPGDVMGNHSGQEGGGELQV